MILVEKDYRLVGKIVSVAHSLEWIHDGGSLSGQYHTGDFKIFWPFIVDDFP